MAATGHKGRFRTLCGLRLPNGRASAVALLIALASYSMARADDSADARGQVSQIANALSEGNAASAMMPIDKSYANYGKLRDYFSGLTGAFQIVNQIDVSDEQHEKDQIKLSVHWDLTLTDLQTNYTESRAADLEIRLNKLKGKWKIMDIEPIDLFNPARGRPNAPHGLRSRSSASSPDFGASLLSSLRVHELMLF